MEFRYLFDDELITVRVEKSGAGHTVTVGDQTFAVEAAMARPGGLWLTVDGVRHVLFVAADGARRWVAFDAQPFVLSVPLRAPRAVRDGAGGHESLTAQMPGVVRKIFVSAGDRVERGQVLVLMEAMKMEMRVSAPHVGVVEKVLVSEGQAVERGQILVEIVEAG